jgi:hypothetical protein
MRAPDKCPGALVTGDIWQVVLVGRARPFFYDRRRDTAQGSRTDVRRLPASSMPCWRCRAGCRLRSRRRRRTASTHARLALSERLGGIALNRRSFCACSRVAAWAAATVFTMRKEGQPKTAVTANRHYPFRLKYFPAVFANSVSMGISKLSSISNRTEKLSCSTCLSFASFRFPDM